QRAHRDAASGLGAMYKQLTAPFGQFGARTLVVSTKALSSSDDTVYTNLEGQIATMTMQRDALANQIKSTLAQLQHQDVSNDWLNMLAQQAQTMITQASDLSRQ